MVPSVERSTATCRRHARLISARFILDCYFHSSGFRGQLALIRTTDKNGRSNEKKCLTVPISILKPTFNEL